MNGADTLLGPFEDKADVHAESLSSTQCVVDPASSEQLTTQERCTDPVGFSTLEQICSLELDTTGVDALQATADLFSRPPLVQHEISATVTTDVTNGSAETHGEEEHPCEHPEGENACHLNQPSDVDNTGEQAAEGEDEFRSSSCVPGDGDGKEEVDGEAEETAAEETAPQAQARQPKKRRKPKAMFSKKRKKLPEPTDETPYLPPRSRVLPNKQLCRDSGYLCAVCRVVFSFNGPCMEHGECKFCALCGSGLVRGSLDGFAVLSKRTDARLSATIDSLHRQNLARCVRLRKRRRPSKSGGADADADAGDGANPAGERSTDQPPATRDASAERATVPYSPWGAVAGKTQSRFCDICGHGSCSVRCVHCSASFHKHCLALPHEYDPPERGWMCYACMHEAIHDSDLPPPASPAPGETHKHKLPDRPMQCSSCGYHEAESLCCQTCLRWLCYACSCVSSATVPEVWSCPECVGQEAYDVQVSDQTAPSRERLPDMTQKEHDGYAQLVFDLSCGCFWEEWERNVLPLMARCESQLDRGELPSVLPFHSLHYPMSKSTLRRISEAYARETALKADRSFKCNPVMENVNSSEQHVWTQRNVARDFGKKGGLSRRVGARLRIGYISSDFVNHPTADLIQSALLRHDRNKFEVFAYSITKDDDSEYRRRLSAELENFITLRSSHTDRKCAETIAEHGIHVLVNLNGHTAGDRNGISALRPAPVQLVYLAYPGTMGASYIDYNVVDDNVCPPAHREHYSEKLLRMPHCYQANSFSDLYREVLDPSKLPSRREHNLPERPTVVFCNFCRLGRVTKELFAMWMRILRRVPDSVIWLYNHPRSAVPRLQNCARAAGVEVSRLVFAPPCTPKIEHLKRVTLADLCLDTLVYNGHTTGSDMLWAGVPMVTMRGDNWPSLVATCLATSVGMPEMVVPTLDAYEEQAVQLALHPERLRALREKLCVRRMSAPLFDSERWIRSFENALERVWLSFAASRQPEDLRADDFGTSDSARHVISEFAPLQQSNGQRLTPAAVEALLREARPLTGPAGSEGVSASQHKCGVVSAETTPPEVEEALLPAVTGSPVDTAPPEGSHNQTPVEPKSAAVTPEESAHATADVPLGAARECAADDASQRRPESDEAANTTHDKQHGNEDRTESGREEADAGSARPPRAESPPSAPPSQSCRTPDRTSLLSEIAEMEREAKSEPASPSPGKLFRSDAVKQLEAAGAGEGGETKTEAEDKWRSSLESLRVQAMTATQHDIMQLTTP